MARQARVRSETDYYHIIMRGNNKTYIFRKPEFKDFFMETVLRLEAEEKMALVAWCIMDSHVHLVLRVPFDDFDRIFKRLNVKYAAYYHRKNKSVGHVFQDRVKSLPLESDESLVNNIRYVHNNPVKAKMTNSPKDYRWSSYTDYLIGNMKEQMKMVKGIIGNSSKAYQEFHLIDDHRVYLDIHEDQKALKEMNAQRIIGEKCRKYGVVDEKELYMNNEVLQEIIATLVEESGLSGRAIAKLVGLSEASIRRLKKYDA